MQQYKNPSALAGWQRDTIRASYEKMATGNPDYAWDCPPESKQVLDPRGNPISCPEGYTLSFPSRHGLACCLPTEEEEEETEEEQTVRRREASQRKRRRDEVSVEQMYGGRQGQALLDFLSQEEEAGRRTPAALLKQVIAGCLSDERIPEALTDYDRDFVEGVFGREFRQTFAKATAHPEDYKNDRAFVAAVRQAFRQGIQSMTLREILLALKALVNEELLSEDDLEVFYRCFQDHFSREQTRRLQRPSKKQRIEAKTEAKESEEENQPEQPLQQAYIAPGPLALPPLPLPEPAPQPMMPTPLPIPPELMRTGPSLSQLSAGGKTSQGVRFRMQPAVLSPPRGGASSSSSSSAGKQPAYFYY